MRSWEKESIDYYLKQLPSNLTIDFVNIGGLQHPKSSKKEIIEKESRMLIEKISKDDLVIAWDSCGEQISSENFASFLSESFEINKSICFLIGGSFGLSAEIKKKSKLSEEIEKIKKTIRKKFPMPNEAKRVSEFIQKIWF